MVDEESGPSEKKILDQFLLYSEFRKLTRDVNENFKTFISQYDQLQKKVGEDCPDTLAKAFDVLIACNLADGDVSNLLDNIEEEGQGNIYDNVREGLLELASEFDTLKSEHHHEEEEAVESKPDIAKIVIPFMKQNEERKTDQECEKKQEEDDIADDIPFLNEEDDNDFFPGEDDIEETPKKESKEDESPGDRINCPYCDLDIHKKSLWKHKRHCKKNPTTIFTKGKSGSKPGNKKKVVKTQSGSERRFTCPECGLSLVNLKAHINSVHLNTRKPCDVCGKMLKTKSYYDHVKTHFKADVEKIMCDKCDYVTYRKDSLRLHIINVHSPKNFSCEHCGMQFGSKQLLKNHEDALHGDMKHCEYCDYQTRSAQSLDFHTKARHTAPTKKMCSLCSFEATDSRDLSEHLATVHGVVSSRKEEKASIFTCKQCDYTCKSIAGIKVHRKTVHEGRRFNCDLCDFQATQKHMVKRHHERVHLKLTHKCRYCDYVTTNKPGLRQHEIRKHNAEIQLFSCHLCNYRTEFKELLQRHLTGKYGKHKNEMMKI